VHGVPLDMKQLSLDMKQPCLSTALVRVLAAIYNVSWPPEQFQVFEDARATLKHLGRRPPGITEDEWWRAMHSAPPITQ
jgi:hypothetical protein